MKRINAPSTSKNAGLAMIVFGLVVGFLINSFDPHPAKRHAGKVLETLTQISREFETGRSLTNLANRARSLGIDLKLIGPASDPDGYIASFDFSDSERVLYATVSKLADLPGEISVDGVEIIHTTNIYSLVKYKSHINVTMTRFR